MMPLSLTSCYDDGQIIVFQTAILINTADLHTDDQSVTWASVGFIAVL